MAFTRKFLVPAGITVGLVIGGLLSGKGTALAVSGLPPAANGYCPDGYQADADGRTCQPIAGPRTACRTRWHPA
jgi:hypothetical protein